MSQPSRAERRRQGRGASAPPPRRDPMRPVYIGVGIAIVALIVFFLGYNWWQKRLVQQAYATPTPAAGPTTKPIQISDGEKLGAPYFKGKFPNTPIGGPLSAFDTISSTAPLARRSSGEG